MQLKVYWVIQTWSKKAVQISDHCSKGGPVQRLIVHAAIDEIGQFCPLGSRKLVPVLVEKIFLEQKQSL